MPKVSIIVPVYKVEKFIERCVRSLFEQTLDDLEYIFVNDCTPDRSMEILHDVLEDYPNRKAQVKIINNDRNLGTARGRMKGMRAATGDFIIHCDTDDWADRTMYERMYNFAIEKGYDLVWCDLYNTNGTRHIHYHQQFHTDKMELYKAFLSIRLVATIWDTLISRRLFQENTYIEPESPIVMEDMVLIIQYIYYAHNIGYLPLPLYYHYYNCNSSVAFSDDYDVTQGKVNRMKQNTHSILTFLEGKGLDKYLKEDILEWKLEMKRYTLHAIFSVKQCRMWINTFPEVNWRVFVSPVRLSQKILALLVLTRLYPFIKSLKKAMAPWIHMKKEG